MCGIAGIINKDGNHVKSSLIKEITDIVTHRGPDGAGYYCEDNFAFGHRRLAILDLSGEGHQPMHYLNGEYTITFNGEIYNFIEIRDELRKYGFEFKSNSDTEVILAAYKHWGKECVNQFNGMWAFALYDKTNKIIFCSRDRYGVKPFYYYNDNQIFVFGSEIKQLISFLPQRRVNKQILLDFIISNYSDHKNETFFQNILKLPAAHNLVYDLKSNSIDVYRYYSIEKSNRIASLSYESAEKEYGDTLKDGIALRLRSDVKVGTCLSGGLDSSSVATIAATLYKENSDIPFSAITAVSTQSNNDESGFAKIVAEHCGMNWIQVKPSYEDFVESLDHLVYSQEEPFGSPSLTMQYFVMKAARENGITVLLDGQGGDETLLGYEKYYAAYYTSIFKKEGFVAALKGIIQSSQNNSKMSLKTILMYLIGGLSARLRFKYYAWRHRYLKEFPHQIPQHMKDFSKACLNEFELQELEIRSSNLPILLRYEDKNSMAHSIETRLPFIDYRTLGIALSLPGQYKMHQGWTKYILRKIMDKHMPDEIVWRKNKFGFEAPENQWLRKHKKNMMEQIKTSKILNYLCDMAKLIKIFDKLDMRTQWRLYSVALWEKKFEVEI
ncbi:MULTISPECIES: asparagine synthase (glutamine-hydrolyzing) [Paenibacillus]|uniref:asparagine synthase (glutamine-hydrolyzing) n=1 Tax=Paenibacillus naphthalenovorans TaxID=162209 RepID=A0A0U2L2Z3_9BACL|nr:MULTISPECIES: asparagine synthase (glutamine-hydrolyzing) [Paenibacillus]ALS24162.1 asparagine synthase [Paenibacillus naphthalenovorans]SDJ84816.1 asparagine synthase (glutamine-hydrolysing) [Paenibacillus naphthalenovorans]